MAALFTDIFRRRSALAIFLPMVLLYASSYFQRTAVPGTIFSQLQSDGLSAFQIAALAASFVYIYSLSQLVVGMLVDQYGGIRVIKIGGLIFCAGALSFPLLSSPWPMYLCRMLVGIGAGTMYLSLVRETDRLFGRENYSVVIGAIYFIGYGGGLMGTLPFERVIACVPWRWTLLVVGAVSVLIYWWFRRAVRTLPPAPVRRTRLSGVAVADHENPLCDDHRLRHGQTSPTVIIQTFSARNVGKTWRIQFGWSGATNFFADVRLYGGAVLQFGDFRLIENRRKPLIIFFHGLALSSRHECGGGAFQLAGWWFAAGFLLYGCLRSRDLFDAEQSEFAGRMTRPPD